MPSLAVRSLLLSAAVFSAPYLLAQEIVHAVSGTVVAVDSAAQTLTLKTNDGSDGLFHLEKSPRPDLIFDKEIRSGTVDPATFNKVGDHVVAYYYRSGFSARVLVALKDFGPSGLEHASGTVLKGKHHELVLKTDAGAIQTFEIAKDASAETPSGVVSGAKFEADPGAKITVRYTEESGRMIAQFIRNAFG